jgi:hypothetical protein
MGISVGSLEQRVLERLRAELAETLAAHLAYPPFFNYRSGEATCRPLDRAKRDELDQFVRSAHFESIERADITSPDVRRFIEQLLLRYIEVNPALARPQTMRRLPRMRTRVPRLAAETQRALVAHLEGKAPAFGTRRESTSWSASSPAPSPREGREHNTRVLEAVLVRRGEVPTPARPRSVVPSPATRRPPSAPPAPSWSPVPGAPAPVPVSEMAPMPGGSPFAGLELGSQTAVFGGTGSSNLSEMETSPLAALGSAFAAGNGNVVESGAAQPRELPPDLYQIYGNYLRDMQPEAPITEAPTAETPALLGAAPPVPAPTPVSAPQATLPSTAAAYAPSAPWTPEPRPEPTPAPSPRAAPMPEVMPGTGVAPADARSDKLIFWQLRYQLEAYVRRAAGSYGVRTASGDPSGVLDALRRSGYVDEADLRIAEGILALTDRVTAAGSASIRDYRQALMLYLLYHRSHLG